MPHLFVKYIRLYPLLSAPNSLHCDIKYRLEPRPKLLNRLQLDSDKFRPLALTVFLQVVREREPARIVFRLRAHRLQECRSLVHFARPFCFGSPASNPDSAPDTDTPTGCKYTLTNKSTESPAHLATSATGVPAATR